MINISQVLESLQQMNIPVVGTVIREPGEQNQYFIFVSVTRDASNKQQPSNRKLDEARSTLSELGAKVEFLLTDAQSRDIESGLRATLLHAFGDEIRNAFLSMDNGIAYVWLDQKRVFEDSVLKSIQSRVDIYLSQFNITLASISNIAGDNLPSILACLKVIRLLSPVNLETLLNQLACRDFTIPSKDWLTRRLDSMRRSGKVVRLDDGRYVLSLASIRNLGTDKGRNSPDVSRLLALARRSQYN